MDCVHNRGSRSCGPGRPATEDAGLRRVCVYHVRFDASKELLQVVVETQMVFDRIDLSDQVLKLMALDPSLVVRSERLHAVEQRAFRAEDGTKRQMNIVSERRLAFAREERVFLASAENETRRDMQDTERHTGQITGPMKKFQDTDIFRVEPLNGSDYTVQ